MNTTLLVVLVASAAVLVVVGRWTLRLGWNAPCYLAAETLEDMEAVTVARDAAGMPFLVAGFRGTEYE